MTRSTAFTMGTAWASFVWCLMHHMPDVTTVAVCVGVALVAWWSE